jgi:hypothetical protein
MDDDSFRKYFYEHILLNGSEEAVVVDNSSCYSFQRNKCPLWDVLLKA